MARQLEPNLNILLKERLNTTPAEIAQFCQQRSIVEFALFGSVLRSDFCDDSDVDILITYLTGYHLRWQDWFEAKEDLEKQFGRPVDLVEKALLKNPYRRAEILKTHQVIYARK